MSEFLQHEHNGVLEFCQKLRTDSARICHLTLFNGARIRVYAEMFEGKIPELGGMTVGEINVYRKLHLNENEELQALVWSAANG